MIVRCSTQMRSPVNTDTLGVYIEYMATAPWNRLDDKEQRIDERFPRVVPVGRLLVGMAIRLSRELGSNGRIGWHSKPRAEKWYRDRFPGIWAGGPDVEEDGLLYFEVSQSVADAYMAGIDQSFIGG
jgi:hypothetical protein